MESKPAVDYSASPGALQGFRVLELSTVIMGPYGAQLLGADVIKVETGEGDSNRDMGGGPHKELGGIALNINRNKRAVSLDLKGSRRPGGLPADTGHLRRARDQHPARSASPAQTHL